MHAHRGVGGQPAEDCCGTQVYDRREQTGGSGWLLRVRVLRRVKRENVRSALHVLRCLAAFCYSRHGRYIGTGRRGGLIYSTCYSYRPRTHSTSQQPSHQYPASAAPAIGTNPTVHCLRCSRSTRSSKRNIAPVSWPIPRRRGAQRPRAPPEIVSPCVHRTSALVSDIRIDVCFAIGVPSVSTA
ncbi:hypothetical protein BU23DRAFT_36284 [Bimuria novae-zelandiae CBS 107.79]|uniref:Uncharacterized protein n=1 Tax=Bimuria novae-zelandiae CBS 107.79 TaxID=1447943 RepID=A0A6A5UVQ1_9PLEO|nr:hypothetical protein BU23DRAFT_36284 [Bimuria novae-zelandiae CBS 107.79]